MSHDFVSNHFITHESKPEDMDRPELIGIVNLLRKRCRDQADELHRALSHIADVRQDCGKLEELNDGLRAEVSRLNGFLECARGDRDTEESMRSALESRIASEVAEANRAIGYAALRLLALDARVNQQ